MRSFTPSILLKDSTMMVLDRLRGERRAGELVDFETYPCVVPAGTVSRRHRYSKRDGPP